MNFLAGTSENTDVKEPEKYEIRDFEKWDDIKELKPSILRGIYAYGFENPSAIQKKSILTFMDRKDLIAQAQSGTGKTGSFAIGVLQNIDTSKNYTQAMILSPTRELSRQIYEVINTLGRFMKELKIQSLIGGTDLDDDISKLKNDTPHVIIGCPGRTHDMLRRRVLNNNMTRFYHKVLKSK